MRSLATPKKADSARLDSNRCLQSVAAVARVDFTLRNAMVVVSDQASKAEYHLMPFSISVSDRKILTQLGINACRS